MKTRQRKIDFIREACISANPDILKLEFGCRVVVEVHSGGFVQNTPEKIEIVSISDGIILSSSSIKVGGHIKEITNVYADLGVYYVNDFNNRKGFVKITEILGRKIGIADVLLIAKKMNPELFHTHIHSVVLMWGLLLNDDLNLQSNETIDFLFSLLGGEE
jgi:hypothetical protein